LYSLCPRSKKSIHRIIVTIVKASARTKNDERSIWVLENQRAIRNKQEKNVGHREIKIGRVNDFATINTIIRRRKIKINENENRKHL